MRSKILKTCSKGRNPHCFLPPFPLLSFFYTANKKPNRKVELTESATSATPTSTKLFTIVEGLVFSGSYQIQIYFLLTFTHFNYTKNIK